MPSRRPSARTAVTTALVAVLAAVALVLAAFAFAQDVPIKISAKATVTPDKAGTPRHPQGVRVDVKTKIDMPSDYDPPLTETVDVWISKGGLYNGGKYPSCSSSTLSRGGVKACPPHSIMGSGSGKASADTVFTYPKITIVNGGASKVFFYTVLKNPARVAAPVPADITKLSTGKWSYKVHVRVPKSLQIVAGIPVNVRSLHGSAGGKAWAKDWLATIGCPAGHRWPYHVEVNYVTGQQVQYNGSVNCH
jgi:hypothetical protein